MKILLQHIRTQLFLKSLGNWTANPYEAQDFETSKRAIDFAQEHTLHGVQVLVKFDDSHLDEAVQLPASNHTKHRHRPRH
jgi:hypothetical protein